MLVLVSSLGLRHDSDVALAVQSTKENDIGKGTGFAVVLAL